MARTSASTDDAAFVVLAKAPRPGLCKTRLEPLLGADGCARLQEVLIRRAAAWAAAAGPAYVAFTPDDAAEEIAALAPGATLIPQAGGDLGDRLAAATGAVLEDHGGPIVLVGVDSPQLHPAHAAAAVDDLRDGIDVTVGPATDGGYYLIGLREPHPELFALPTEKWGGEEVLQLTFAAATEARLSLGMLRSERDLDDPQDARAFLADPLTPADVRAALAG